MPTPTLRPSFALKDDASARARAEQRVQSRSWHRTQAWALDQQARAFARASSLRSTDTFTSSPASAVQPGHRPASPWLQAPCGGRLQHAAEAGPASRRDMAHATVSPCQDLQVAPTEPRPAAPGPVTPTGSLPRVLDAFGPMGPTLLDTLRDMGVVRNYPMPEGLSCIQRRRHWVACTEHQRQLIESGGRRVMLLNTHLTVWADGQLVCATVRELRALLRR